MVLTAGAFQSLLSALGPDREAAGEKYELIRLKLLKYFEWRNCEVPEELADETLDRVARRLGEGEQIRAGDLMLYVYGVAHNVLLEFWKRQQREHDTAPVEPSTAAPFDEQDEWEKEARLTCLRRCLMNLPDDTRELLTRYYQDGGRVRIETRQDLARTLKIPMNALRIRIHRIKEEVLRCIDECVKGQKR